MLRGVLWVLLATFVVVPELGNADQCRILNARMTPSDDLQMVVWLEDDQGNFVETLYITRETGTYGLGNRPGIMEFNSAFAWPYGRRTTTFPVWARRHGMSWPLVVFQDGDDDDLSHSLSQSSVENHFCRPLKEGEAMWDTATCSTPSYTDKGIFSSTDTSFYPPRADLVRVPGTDSGDVADFKGLNPFDAISRATPPGGLPMDISWAIPADLPLGDYTLWVEVSKEWDQNANYDFPSPTGIAWSEYGLPSRGQPSILYRADFEIGAVTEPVLVPAYAGYGDPEGLDGNIRTPDSTITTGVAGSGADRLLLMSADGEMFRLQVAASISDDAGVPGGAQGLKAVQKEETPSEAMISFIAPGDDGMSGQAAGYEIRYIGGVTLSEENFFDGIEITGVNPMPAGTLQSFVVDELVPQTNYSVAIRAYDECFNYGPVTVVEFRTEEIQGGPVDACFVATAAYGSLLANQVTPLRKARDMARKTVLGELAVEAYYSVGPSLADVIGESETLRRLSRSALTPLAHSIEELRAEAAN